MASLYSLSAKFCVPENKVDFRAGVTQSQCQLDRVKASRILRREFTPIVQQFFKVRIW